MSERNCAENPLESAPRDGCGCRECYRARAEKLPVELTRMALPWPAEGLIPIRNSPSRAFIYHFLQAHCCGHLPYDDAIVGLVKALAENYDKLMSTEFDRAALAFRAPKQDMQL